MSNNSFSSYSQVSALPQGGSTLFVGVEVESVQQTVPVTISDMGTEYIEMCIDSRVATRPWVSRMHTHTITPGVA